MSRLTTVEELQALPNYTPILGHATVPVLAHRSPNGVWWSTVENPMAVETLVNMCPGGFEVLYSDDRIAADQTDLRQVLEAIETLEFFSRFEPVNHEDRMSTRDAAGLLRAYILRDAKLKPSDQGD